MIVPVVCAVVVVGFIAIAVMMGALSPKIIFVNDTGNPIRVQLLTGVSGRILPLAGSLALNPGEEKRQSYDWESAGVLAALASNPNGIVIFCPPAMQNTKQEEPVYRWSAFTQSQRVYTNDTEAVGACSKYPN